MRIVIRADASLEIGTGHVMRCLTLALAMREKGAEISFVCREDAGNLCGLVETMGFQCRRLARSKTGCKTNSSAKGASSASDSFQWMDARQTVAAIEAFGGRPDLLVIDHYMLDKYWETVLRPHVDRIFVIDDLADRAHDCDVLLDQNLHDSLDARYSYAGLVSANARVFLGPKYALLRPEFDSVRAAPRTEGLRRLLVFFGGADATNESLKLLQALRLMGSTAPETDLVLGPVNVHQESVFSAASGLACVNVVGQSDDMAGLMRGADLGVGTCGVAAWERCGVGLPSLVVVSAENQRDDARILHAIGAVKNLGDAVNTSIERWVSEVRHMQEEPALLAAMSVAAASVMRGRGEAKCDLEAALVS